MINGPGSVEDPHGKNLSLPYVHIQKLIWNEYIDLIVKGKAIPFTKCLRGKNYRRKSL